MTDTFASNFRFNGWHMWAILIAFFGIDVGVNVLLAVVSARSWTGMVVDDPYVAGQLFETQRKAHEAQLAAGWTPDLIYAPGAARLVIIDGAGHPVDLGDVKVLINRPVGGHDDQTLDLVRKPDGSYEAPLTLPDGAWDATVTAEKTQLGPFELVRRLFVENGK